MSRHRYSAVSKRLFNVLPSRTTLGQMRRSPGRDLAAGLTVGVVALPLALGFGVASGMGAKAGLITAAVAGIVAALFGGSNFQVSGPTGAMTVVLVPIVHQFGSSGVLTVGLFAGVLLIALAALGASRWMAFVPTPVIEGFTVGIATVIIFQQIPAALGEKAQSSNPAIEAARAVSNALHHPHWAPIGLCLAVVVALVVGARQWPSVPLALPVVIVASIIASLAHVDAATLGHIPAGFPRPSVSDLRWSGLAALLPSAVAVALLAALESLMSAAVADGMSIDERHDGDRELFGQGLSNIAVALMGGVPGNGAIARTAVNIRSGAVSRLSAVIHGLVISIVILAAAPVVAHIPIAALSGVLIAMAGRMVDVGAVRAMARSGRSDLIVMTVTALTTIAVNLVTAVLVGLLVAGALALRTLARTAGLTGVDLHDGLTPADHHAAEQALLAEHIVAYRLDGPVFFAAAHRFLIDVVEQSHARVVILRVGHVTHLDASGAKLIDDLVATLERHGAIVLISGLQADHERTVELLDVLANLRAEGRVFPTTPDAIAAARDLLSAQGVLSA